MKYRKLGSTGLEVSALGLGCMRLPTQRLRFQKIDVPKATELIRAAVDKGVNYIDTGWPYHFGESERILGDALRDGYRERVHLVTKLPMFLTRKESDFDRFLNRQLEKLQTDHLDTYLFHGLNSGGFEKLKRLKLMERMLAAKADGRVRHIGFSFHDILPVFRLIVDFYDWDVVQIQYNYMDTAVQATTEGLKYAAGKGMGIVIMEPLKGGKLANPPAEAIRVMRESKSQRSSVDWALQYLWNMPEVSVVLSGMGSMQMLNDNCESADRSGVGSLSIDDLSTVDRLTEIFRESILVPCTACQYCMPCPAGVNIPKNFAIFNNVYAETSPIRRWMARRSYRSLADNKKQLDGDKMNGRATMCTECGACVPKCPQSIAIPEELKKVDIGFKRGKKGG